MPPTAGPECIPILKQSLSLGLCGIMKVDAALITSSAKVAISETCKSPNRLATAKGIPEATT